MRRNRFLLAGLVLGGMMGAAYAARQWRRPRYTLSTDPLLGWRGDSGLVPVGSRTPGSTALASGSVPRGAPMSSPDAG